MPDTPRQDFRFVPLDPNALLAPFQVQTNWHVLTGAPSCGKTTLIDLLAERGFQTVPEIAHDFIESEMASGRTLEEIFGDRLGLQKELISLQQEAEQDLKADQLAFLDRALGDGVTFGRFVGLDPNDLLRDCFCHRYASVFILDPLPYQVDGIRDVDAPHAAFLDEWLDRDYCALGYEVIRVPVLPPLERLDFILERIPDSPF